MTNLITSSPDEPHRCVCGALLGLGQDVCRKCRARETFAKRERGAKRAKRRAATRRPPNGPRRAHSAGVTL
ncbi:hypothetical protein [Herbidospora cretacea]|uniref:hypothetical protein n=1 Tax=Herbidospora cretacea TaxID=28444 RepID=UPI000B0F6713|nr:hypothetical protein [Herbidospora cretacea]